MPHCPFFALSDIFLGQVSTSIGGTTATVYAAWAAAVLAVPVLLAHAPTRDAVIVSLKNRNGILGTLLTGVFLTAGVACIGEAFQHAGGAVVIVNVFAMLSGILLLLVTVLRREWLETQPTRVYQIRLAGVVLLIGAATLLQLFGH